MTLFEIIILILIYLVCYGGAFTLLKIDDESNWDIAIRIVGSVIIAIFIPIIIGIQIANKLSLKDIKF